jgi:hypothetical protein
MNTMQCALAALAKWIRLPSRIAAPASQPLPAPAPVAVRSMTKTQAEEILDWMEANGQAPPEVQLTPEGFIFTDPKPKP